eukprot:1146966-Pelagomonas_calceolata.AAC.2
MVASVHQNNHKTSVEIKSDQITVLLAQWGGHGHPAQTGPAALKQVVHHCNLLALMLLFLQALAVLPGLKADLRVPALLLPQCPGAAHPLCVCSVCMCL